MKRSFEELDIWQLARALQKEIWMIFYDEWFKNYNFQSQIMRAVLSISNNIAEWNDKFTTKDKINFLFIAKWSAAEVRNMLYAAFDFWYISEIQLHDFLWKSTTLSVKIFNLITYLKTRPQPTK